MKQYSKITCPQCNKDDLVKNGHSENGTQRYRCKSCKKSFQLDYTYNEPVEKVHFGQIFVFCQKSTFSQAHITVEV